ncbi:MAG: hypothetical protein N3B16_11735 [Candidatus Aminicenantes bacterium]|nr:hypothetical protein [Candidatus Aminicenantes bacterium]
MGGGGEAEAIEGKPWGRVFGRGEELGEGALEGPEVLYLQVDDTGVNDRERKGWIECRVGASFSRRARLSKCRVWLKVQKEGDELVPT